MAGKSLSAHATLRTISASRRSLGESSRKTSAMRDLAPAQALGLEGAQWMIVLELLIDVFFIGTKQPIDVAEAEPIEGAHHSPSDRRYRRAGRHARRQCSRVDLAAPPLELGLNRLSCAHRSPNSYS
jgi:hypothetical protein